MGDGTESPLWARVELMGHSTSAGRISHNSQFGMIQLDIPTENGFHTELYGAESVFRIRFINETVARALALALEKQGNQVVPWDAPVMMRADHERVVTQLRAQVVELERLLEASNSLQGQQVALFHLPDPQDRREGWAQTSDQPDPQYTPGGRLG